MMSEDGSRPKKKRRNRKVNNTYITITGQNHYLGMRPYKVGRIVKLVKDRANEYDESAIRVELPFLDTVGYVANSVNTVYAGTYSAGRLYDKIDAHAYAKVMFITHSSVIARVLSPEELEREHDCETVDIPLPPTRAPLDKIGF